MNSSSASSAEFSQVIELFESIEAGSYCVYAAMALLAYEYTITFGAEIDLFWRRKLTGASLLFFANRYLPLILHIYQLSDSGTLSNKSCLANLLATQALTVAQYVPWAAFSGLRAFALSGRNWSIAALVFLLSMVNVGINLSQYHWLSYSNTDLTGCNAVLPVSQSLEKIFTTVSRTTLIAADAIVILITWHATYKTSRLSEPAWGKGRSFAHTLQRDGTLYFVVLVVLDSLHLAFTLRSLAIDGFDPTSYVTLFTEPITAVLVSRFLIDLQSVNQNLYNGADSLMSTTVATQTGTIMFARVLGSLGSSVAADEHLDNDESEPTMGGHTEE